MGSYKTNLVTDQTLDVLLSGAAQATTTGRLFWRVQKPRVHEGKIEVLTRLSDCAVGELRIYYVDPRPSEIHCQYLVNGAPIRRLDVNGSHRKIVNKTHKHTYIPSSGTESFYYPDDIPSVPFGPTVAVDTYRVVFEAFAKECHVLLGDGYWTQP